MDILKNEKNETIIKDKRDENTFYYLFSYNCEIAIYCERSESLAISKEWWNYSQSTLKHFKNFVNNYTAYTYETKQQFQKLIEEKQKTDFKIYETNSL